jgi:flagellar protein FliL
MAEDDFGEEEGPKKSKVLIILIIVILLALLGGGGYYAYITFFQKPAAEAPAEGEATKEGEASKDGEAPPGEGGKEMEIQPGLGVMVPLEPFIINLANSQGNRFLKVTVTLELSSPEVHAEVNENVQKITDSILILLSSKSFEDVYSIQGKFKLKDEITTRVNRFLVLGHVKDAYFTEFVIQ